MKSINIKLTKKEIKILFRSATGFCKWDEYERGYKIRNNNVTLGIDFFILQIVNIRNDSSKNTLIDIDYKKLYSAIRKVVDESYLLYYNINGTFREDKVKVTEKNVIADSLYTKFLKSLN